MFKHLLYHEWKLLLREPRFWLPFLLPPLLLMGTQLWMAGLQMPADPRLLFTMGALLCVMGGTLSADSFAGERERNTLELLFSLPVSRETLFWAKVFAILPIPLFFSFLSQILFSLLFPGLEGSLLLKSLLFSFSIGLLITALSVWVSLRVSSVRAAGQFNALMVLAVLVWVQILLPWVLKGWEALLLWFFAGILFFAVLVRLSLRKFH